MLLHLKHADSLSYLVISKAISAMWALIVFEIFILPTLLWIIAFWHQNIFTLPNKKMCIPSCIRKWFTTSDKKPVRKAISQQTRMQIAFQQDYICPMCKQPLSSAWDVDHVVRLADNGTNSPCNLQVICTSCHRIKTAKENTKNKKKVCQERICAARNQGYKCAICHRKHHLYFHWPVFSFLQAKRKHAN